MRLNAKLLTGLLIVFCVTEGCRSVRSLDQVSRGDLLFSYERTPCFGYCPVYAVSVLKNGRIYFSGKRFVPVADTVITFLSDRSLRQVEAIMAHPEFQYMVVDTPEHVVMDIPGLNFYDYLYERDYRFGAELSIVPEGVQALTSRVDEVLTEAGLLYDRSRNPMVREEVILSLESGIGPEDYEGQAAHYELSYLREIGNGLYLFELRTGKSDVKTVLEEIGRRQGVREIQLNHELERRNR